VVKREKIKKVIEILKKIGRVQRNQLVRVVVDEYKEMSHQTANDAINEAIKLNQIIREEDQRGKQKIVWLSVSPDISKDEKSVLQFLENQLQKYDRLFLVFKEKYRNLTTKEKADGVDNFLYLLMQFNLITDAYTTIYSRTKKWTNLMQEIPKRLLDITNLYTNDSEKIIGKIFQNIILQKFWDVNDAFEDIENFLKKIKK